MAARLVHLARGTAAAATAAATLACAATLLVVSATTTLGVLALDLGVRGEAEHLDGLVDTALAALGALRDADLVQGGVRVATILHANHLGLVLVDVDDTMLRYVELELCHDRL